MIVAHQIKAQNPDTGGSRPRRLCAKKPPSASPFACLPRKPALRISHLATPLPRSFPDHPRPHDHCTPRSCNRAKPATRISFQRSRMRFCPGRVHHVDPFRTGRRPCPKSRHDAQRFPIIWKASQRGIRHIGQLAHRCHIEVDRSTMSTHARQALSSYRSRRGS